MKFKNIKGKKFGALTVKKYLGKTEYNKSKWLCLCDCNKTTIALTGHLLSGARKSCGCRIHRKNKRVDLKLLCTREIIRQYKKNAKKRNKVWKLSEEDVLNIIFNPCYYCGTKKSNLYVDKRSSHKNSKEKIKYNGIDRKNNSLGYTNNNVVPCCKQCNIMKNVLTEKQFYKHIRKILNYKKK